MPKLEFTSAELKAYFTDKRKYYYCDKAREKEKEMRVHADGIFPGCLIEERRPSESIEVLTYRKKIFKPITKPYFGKIENTLQKIRRSSDWSIKYPDASFDRVVDGEKMNDYAEHNYPEFESLTNWAFSLLLRNYLIDANALVLVAPWTVPTGENKYLEPVATIFNSCDVIDFADQDYAVIENKVGSSLWRSGDKPGRSFYIITTEMIWKYEQSDGRQNYTVTFEHQHELGLLPVFKLGGIVIDVYGTHSLYESRIAGILPQFDEALREYSDLQAAKVLHMFPREWEFTQNECLACKGQGTRIDNTQNPPCQVECKACEGRAYIASGPYSKMLVRPAAADQQQVPNPAAGIIQRDSKIIELQETSVDGHIYKALAAINFEFLTTTPMNQSGTAKEVDKDELNNMVHSIAEDIVRIMDKVYYWIALYRYSALYTPDEIYKMLPMIAVPEKYDILGAAYYQEQMKGIIDSKLNPAIRNAMEITFATKAFNSEPKVAEEVALILSLDPLAGISEDDKMSRLSNGGITKLDYITSSNINKFVANAMETIKGFADMDITKQKEAIRKMAEAQMGEETAALLPDDLGGGDIGKLPLALQQLTLAATRAEESGDTKLANLLRQKATEITQQLA